MNIIAIIGNVTKDPDYVQLQNGAAKASFVLAVQRRYTNAQGVREADFIPCVAWREKAEFAHKYVTKGKKLAVTGSLQVRSYDAQDGSKRTISEVVIDDLEFVAPKGDAGKAEVKQETPEEKAQRGEMVEVAEGTDDLPF